jgi:hypothetical protein
MKYLPGISVGEDPIDEVLDCQLLENVTFHFAYYLKLGR